MIIVFANMKEKEFDLYTDSGRTTIPFVQAGLVKNIVGSDKVLYVTAATYVNTDQLISLADSAGPVAQQGEPIYIHTTRAGCLVISEPEMKLSFNGPADFKSIDDIGVKDINQSPLLSRLLKSGDLEIVSESKVKRIKARLTAEKQIQTKKQAAEMANRITTTEHTSGLAMQPIGKDMNPDDIIPIDVEKVSFGGGGSTTNEGSLLPADML